MLQDKCGQVRSDDQARAALVLLPSDRGVEFDIRVGLRARGEIQIFGAGDLVAAELGVARAIARRGRTSLLVEDAAAASSVDHRPAGCRRITYIAPRYEYGSTTRASGAYDSCTPRCGVTT